MAAENTSQVTEAHPMKGGDGPNSYAKNSTFQRDGVDAAKELMSKAIAEKLDIEILPSNTFRIADLGCSVGPNTFLAVENILEAVKSKFQSQGLNSQIPEFHVFLNDHTSNDFNMLFKTLPQNRRYYAAGVPGSFYGRLFPNASIHLAHSSYAIQWLSRVPKAVVDSNSPAWNKGQIHYSNSTDEVLRAYETQHTEDMECFLHARAQEIVYGGLMLLNFPGRPNGTPHSDASPNVIFQLLGSSLMDLVRKKGAVNAAKELLNKAIAEKLDIEVFLPSTTFHIADLGCSTGPNTFLAIQNILEAVESKYQRQGLKSQIPEFFVFFNDHTSNDFNMLFKSLPQNRRYYAAGAPGSFYGRVFPNASIHFVYSSTAIQWLSRVPTAVVDSNSPAWNKGRIHYSNSTDEVIKAYETQHSDDMESFLHARAQEIVYGGLMVLTFPGCPSDTPHSDATPNVTLQLLGSSLMDLVRKGVVSEEKVDSFNIPMYSMSPQELAAAVERNGCFSIEMTTDLPLPSVDNTLSLSQLLALHMRAGVEGILKQQFGEEILDELFDLYHNKCEEHISTITSGKPVNFLVVLRRKAD